jgi:hypothetical protein
MDHPVDVLARVQSHILGHTSHEEIMVASLLGDGHGLPLQFLDSTDPVGAEQLEAADMDPPE